MGLLFCKDLFEDLVTFHNQLQTLLERKKRSAFLCSQKNYVLLFWQVSMIPQKQKKFLIMTFGNKIHAKNIRELLQVVNIPEYEKERLAGWGIILSEKDKEGGGSLVILNNGYFYPFSGLWKGIRDDKYSLSKFWPAFHGTEYRKRLVQYYKIHLMSKTGQEDIILWKFLKAALNDPELPTLINEFKVQADLDRKHDKEGLVLPTMVIYPAEGQENVQKLIYKLCEIFKGDGGSGITPRFNTPLSSLIYYAQADADFKNAETRNDFFDASTNYALYKPDFTGEVEDYHLKPCLKS